MKPYLMRYNVPVPVVWAGWESDTFRLQQAGWEISMIQDPRGIRKQMAINHSKYKMQGLSNYEELDMNDPMMRSRGRLNVHPFIMQYMATSIVLNIHHLVTVEDFKPVNCEPEFLEVKGLRFEDCIPFRPIMEEEVIVHPSSVPELMEEILRKQEPTQQDIRERRKRGHARIITLT